VTPDIRHYQEQINPFLDGNVRSEDCTTFSFTILKEDMIQRRTFLKNLTAADIQTISIEDLGFRLLEFFASFQKRDEQRRVMQRAYIGSNWPVSDCPSGIRHHVSHALLEAWAWLEQEGLIAQESTGDAYRMSRKGEEALRLSEEQRKQVTVFYSWQSDLPNSVNRGFIEDCLRRAIRNISATETLGIEPCLDRDTQNTPGAPDIAATIFDKIDKCHLFVCDVSIVNQNASNRPTPNPNVLIELGYAVKTLGWNRIICVFNEATGGIQDLPFDLRQRRVRSYQLREGEDKADQRKLLMGLLKADLGHIFNDVSPKQGELGNLESSETGSHSIRFNVDDWTVWQEPVYDPDDGVVVINQWKAGDFLYSCTIRLRNQLGWDDERHRLRMEFRHGDKVLLEDTYAFTDGSVVLPPQKWVSISVCYGVHEDGVFAASDSVWFVAETVGDNSRVAWLVANLSQISGKQAGRP
jgi:hypothetical protein